MLFITLIHSCGTLIKIASDWNTNAQFRDEKDKRMRTRYIPKLINLDVTLTDFVQKPEAFYTQLQHGKVQGYFLYDDHG